MVRCSFAARAHRSWTLAPCSGESGRQGHAAGPNTTLPICWGRAVPSRRLGVTRGAIPCTQDRENGTWSRLRTAFCRCTACHDRCCRAVGEPVAIGRCVCRLGSSQWQSQSCDPRDAAWWGGTSSVVHLKPQGVASRRTLPTGARSAACTRAPAPPASQSRLRDALPAQSLRTAPQTPPATWIRCEHGGLGAGAVGPLVICARDPGRV